MRYALAALAVVVASGGAGAQTARFERAETFAARTGGKVFRASVAPHWLANGTLWYKVALPGGKSEYVVVDPVKATRLVVPKPPVASEAARGVAPQSAPPVSRAGGDDTTITFTNSTEDEVRLEWIGTDGARVPYGTLKPGATHTQHTFAGHWWLVSDSGGKPLVAFEATSDASTADIRGRVLPAPPSRVVAPPSPRLVVHNNNVFRRDPAGETPLTRDGTAQDGYEGTPLLSPDGKFAVVMRTTPAQSHLLTLVQSSPRDQVQPRVVTREYLKPGDVIAHPRPHLFAVETGEQIPLSDALFPAPFELTDMVWEADSARFTFRTMERGFQTCRVISVDAHTGAARAVVDEHSATFIDWTNTVYLHRVAGNTHEALWQSERDGWSHLYLVDTLTGAVKNRVTTGPWVVRGVEQADDAKRQVILRVGGFYPAHDPYYIQYVRVNYDGTGLVPLTQADGTHRIEFSPSGAYYVDTFSRVDLPPVTELHRTDTGAKVVDLETGDASALLATGWRYPQRFVAKGRDGVTDIYGVIVRPTNFDPARKYPVIENIYAGPQGAFTPKAFSTQANMMALADLGFIVVQCDGMGTNFRSKAFHDVCWHNLADAGFPDRIAWIKAAAGQNPEMDTARVGIYGTSAGGQNALGGLLLHGDFYRVGVADCGCHDNRMDKLWWNEQWMGYPVGDHYAAQSNVTLAPRLTGKLLLLVGEMDTNVDPASTLQVVDALARAGKEFDFYLAPGVGHGVVGTPAGRHRLWDFFQRNL